jgi:hypothetical protein
MSSKLMVIEDEVLPAEPMDLTFPNIDDEVDMIDLILDLMSLE